MGIGIRIGIRSVNRIKTFTAALRKMENGNLGIGNWELGIPK
jgi:hypothetical protein